MAIVSLTGASYPTWKVKCKMSLMKDGMWEIVDGSKRAPSTSDSAYSKFITRRDCALATIILSINPYLLYLIGDPTEPTAVEAMYTISKEYIGKQVSPPLIFALREGQSIQENVKAIIEIFNELFVIG